MTQLRFDELKAAGQLPSPTGVALAIVRLMHKDGTTIQEVARVLQSDPALTGRILKMANSAAMGASRPVATVQEAMVRLGVLLVRQLSLSFSVLASSRSGQCEAFDYGAFWSRSLAMAVAAQLVSRHMTLIASDEAFTCGLLSHVGSLGLASIYPKEYAEILRACTPGPRDRLLARERECFVMDQVELGAALLSDWGLPEICVEAVRSYMDIDNESPSDNSRVRSLVTILDLAERMASICVAAESSRERLVAELFDRAGRAGISKHELIPLCDRVASEWKEWGRTLEVTTQDVPPFAELAERSLHTEIPNALHDGAPDEFASTPLDILVIGTNIDVDRALVAELQSSGHRIRTCADCNDGLRIILEARPHLVLLDWVTAGANGAEFCRTVRGTLAGRELYILAMIDAAAEEDCLAVFSAGASDYVTKPLRSPILTGRIRACQQLTRLQEEMARDKDELRRLFADLSVANRQLQLVALTDALTGLPNRRYMTDRLQQEWAGACRHNRHLSCMILDLDHFKAVNDKHGHDVGDIVLKSTATILRITTRKSDTLCRIGGEEFIVICPDTDLESAVLGGERLRKAVESSIVDAPGFGHAVTVSIGVASRSATTETIEAMLKAADDALYDAKRTGRNRVCCTPNPAARALPIQVPKPAAPVPALA
jgi:two-component system cell cycle response regulator